MKKLVAVVHREGMNYRQPDGLYHPIRIYDTGEIEDDYLPKGVRRPDLSSRELDSIVTQARQAGDAQMLTPLVLPIPYPSRELADSSDYYNYCFILCNGMDYLARKLDETNPPALAEPIQVAMTNFHEESGSNRLQDAKWVYSRIVYTIYPYGYEKPTAKEALVISGTPSQQKH